MNKIRTRLTSNKKNKNFKAYGLPRENSNEIVQICGIFRLFTNVCIISLCEVAYLYPNMILYIIYLGI